MVTLVVLVWAGPALYARLWCSPGMSLWAAFDAQHCLARPFVFLLGGLGLSTLALRSAAPRRPATADTVLLRALLITIVLCEPLFAVRFLGRTDAEAYEWPALLVAVALIHVVDDTLRRPQLRPREFATRMMVVLTVLWLVGVLISATSAYLSWGCIGSTYPIEYAAFRTADAYAIRIVCGFVAASCGWLVLAQRYRQHPRNCWSLTPLLGLVVWLTGRVVVDALTQRAAFLVLDPATSAIRGVPADPSRLSMLASLADAVGGATTVAAILIWLWAPVVRAFGARANLRATWRRTWPLLPLLWLVTSPVFEPSLVTSTDSLQVEPLWVQMPGFEPLHRPQHRDMARYTLRCRAPCGVLTHTGQVRIVQRRRGSFHVQTWAPIATPGAGEEVQLVVDRRATLADLAQAERQLAGFAAVSLLWSSNGLDETSARARSRWSFLELAARSYGGRTIRFLAAPPEHCEQEPVPELRPARLLPCLDNEGHEVLLMVPSPDLSLAAWFQATEHAESPIVQVLPTDRRLAHGASLRRSRPGPRAVTSRAAPTLPIDSFLIAACIALLLLTRRLRRELRLVDALSRGRVLPRTPAPGPTHPPWVSWRLATLSAECASDSGGPYRRASNSVAFAPPGVARRELWRLASAAARIALRALAYWVFLLAVGTGLGFACIRLFVPF